MSRVPLRVIKLGGSLLESADWDLQFTHWFASLPPARTLLLVGGGPPVDAIRQLAELRTYDAEFMHWLCIDAMDISYRIAGHRLSPSWQSIESADQLQAWQDKSPGATAIVHIRSFYTSHNYRSLLVPLPLNWDTTSDSLSALLAKSVSADELILLKSRPVLAPYNWPDLAQAGVVDKAFPMAVGGLRHVRIDQVTTVPTVSKAAGD
jgi:5-(aminomethyl)-3-furanmethanol phosphate kinase